MKINDLNHTKTIPWSSIEVYHFFTYEDGLYQKLSNEYSSVYNVQNTLWWPGMITSSFIPATMVCPREITELHHKVLND